MDRSKLNRIREIVLGRMPEGLARDPDYFRGYGDNLEVQTVLTELQEEGQITILPDGRLCRVIGAKTVPAMHKDYKVGTRVAFKFTPDDETKTGRIDGISHTHIVYTYMVTLDKPLPNEAFKDWKVVSVMGTLITEEL